MLFFFFFSSRRRHTRSLRDWSSDVCSSDLLARAAGPRHRPPRAAGEGRMRRLRIGFLFRRPYGAGHVSIFPKTLEMLADAGVVVDVIAGNGRLIDLSSVRVEHDLYVLKQISGIPM